MTITKDSLVEMVHNEIGLNKREAKDLIECFFEQIKSSLENGNDIKLSGFGNFTLRTNHQGLVEILKLARRL